MNRLKRGLKRAGWLLAVAMLLANLGAAGLPGQLPAPIAWVDAQAMTDTANGQVGSFLVLLKDQADLAAVPALSAGLAPGSSLPGRLSAAWAAQGRAVVDGLHQAADRSQPALLAFLDSKHAAAHAYWIANLVAVQGDRDLLDALAARPDVAAIESNRAFKVPLETPDAVTPASPQAPQGVEPNLFQVHATELWGLGITGQGMVFASADTGVSWDHPALKTHYRGWNAADSSVNHNFNWWDAITNANKVFAKVNPCGYQTQAPCDDWGHGTHTTGTAVGDDGLGNQVGLAPGAKWIACRNMDSGTGRPEFYIACLQFFMAPTDLTGNPSTANPALRPDVIDNSYSCPPSELCAPHALQAAVLAVRQAGIFMSVSAGNAGPGCITIQDPPGLEAGVFTVGAVDGSNQIAGFSSRGPVTIDGTNLLKPQLVAPGVNIRSSTPGNQYGTMSGTSMAAPHVAGAVLLLWSGIPGLRYNVDRTERLIEKTALPLTNAQGCGGYSSTAVPNPVYGYGLLNINAAYQSFPSIMLYEINLPVVIR